MISNFIYQKAKNLEVAKTFENNVRIEFVVGQTVVYHKLTKKFSCNCTGHAVWNVGSCSFQLACALKGENIPKEIKEWVEEEVK